MGRISFEGKIGIFLALIFGLGAGSMMVWPGDKEIGWAIMAISAVGLVALAIYHFSELWTGSPRIISPSPVKGVLPGKRGERKFIPLTVAEYMATLQDKSELQRSKMINLHKESWIRVKGKILGPGLDGWAAISFFMSPTMDPEVKVGNYPVHVAFDKQWAQAVALFSTGTPVTVIGQLQSYTSKGNILYIIHSELEVEGTGAS